MAKPVIKFAIKYEKSSDMIKAAINAGFKHIGGDSLLCKNCGHKRAARKFTKDRGIMYGCNLCKARWGSLIKEPPRKQPCI